MELDKLLNKLIEKGREPFGSYKDIITRYKYDNRFFDFNHEGDNMVSIRELVSKESGLWQFVCENEMIVLKLSARMENPRIDFEDVDDYNNGHIVMNYKQKCEGDKAEYRIIQSALCDEDKLEKFLLDNIKI